MFFFLEYCLVAILIVGAYFLRSFPSGWFKAAEQHLSRLARRRALAGRNQDDATLFPRTVQR
jgi:hypothetical protein